MDYLEIYKSRVGHLGTTPQERAFSSGILEFRRYLKYNQHTVFGLINERNNLIFDGVILTDKEDENRVSQILLTELNQDIKPGDLILWNDEHWIIWRSTTSSYQPHQKFYMVRCNYEIKWVDELGIIQKSWIYLLGHKDSKIKDNFRTWNNLITPQPNKYINIILPYRTIKQGTEIMVLDEVWYLVDDDRSSVPGISFMSFTETNLNEQRDDLTNSLANADTIAKIEIVLPSYRAVMPLSTFEVSNYSILRNGIKDETAIPSIVVEGDFTEENGILTAAQAGSGKLILSYEGVKAEQILEITETIAETLIIVGNEKIRVGREAVYEVNTEEPVTFTLVDNKDLATLEIIDNTHCCIKANNNNKVGQVGLEVATAQQTVRKKIEIISLWQVI